MNPLALPLRGLLGLLCGGGLALCFPPVGLAFLLLLAGRTRREAGGAAWTSCPAPPR